MSNWFWPQGRTFLHVFASEIVMRLLPAHCFSRTLLEVGQGRVCVWIPALMHPAWPCPHPLPFWVPKRTQQCFPLLWLGGFRSSQACECTVHWSPQMASLVWRSHNSWTYVTAWVCRRINGKWGPGKWRVRCQSPKPWIRELAWRHDLAYGVEQSVSLPRLKGLLSLLLFLCPCNLFLTKQPE